MQENQKVGFLIILGAAVFIIFAFLISDNSWFGSNRGFYQEFIGGYLINLFGEKDCYDVASVCYAISFHTKWAVFAGICIAAYGLTVYKGIINFPPCKKQD